LVGAARQKPCPPPPPGSARRALRAPTSKHRPDFWLGCARLERLGQRLDLVFGSQVALRMPTSTRRPSRHGPAHPATRQLPAAGTGWHGTDGLGTSCPGSQGSALPACRPHRSPEAGPVTRVLRPLKVAAALTGSQSTNLMLALANTAAVMASHPKAPIRLSFRDRCSKVLFCPLFSTCTAVEGGGSSAAAAAQLACAALLPLPCVAGQAGSARDSDHPRRPRRPPHCPPRACLAASPTHLCDAGCSVVTNQVPAQVQAPDGGI